MEVVSSILPQFLGCLGVLVSGVCVCVCVCVVFSPLCCKLIISHICNSACKTYFCKTEISVPKDYTTSTKKSAQFFKLTFNFFYF